MRTYLGALSDAELSRLEARLQERVRTGTASLEDFGRLAHARSELARRREPPTGAAPAARLGPD